MKLEFSDYDGPTGLYVATGTEILPLASPEGAAALMETAAWMSDERVFNPCR